MLIYTVCETIDSLVKCGQCQRDNWNVQQNLLHQGFFRNLSPVTQSFYQWRKVLPVFLGFHPVSWSHDVSMAYSAIFLKWTIIFWSGRKSPAWATLETLWSISTPNPRWRKALVAQLFVRDSESHSSWRWLSKRCKFSRVPGPGGNLNLTTSFEVINTGKWRWNIKLWFNFLDFSIKAYQ